MNSTPDYYKLPGLGDVADVIEAAGWGRGFRLGNVLKYVLRAGRKIAHDEKADVAALRDLYKAKSYIDAEINAIEAARGWVAGETSSGESPVAINTEVNR